MIGVNCNVGLRFDPVSLERFHAHLKLNPSPPLVSSRLCLLMWLDDSLSLRQCCARVLQWPASAVIESSSAVVDLLSIHGDPPPSCHPPKTVEAVLAQETEALGTRVRISPQSAYIRIERQWTRRSMRLVLYSSTLIECTGQQRDLLSSTNDCEDIGDQRR